MKRRFVRLTAALAGAALIGGGVTLYALVPSGGEKEIASQDTIASSAPESALDCLPAGVPIPSPTTIDPWAPKPVPPNPDAGLSDSERNAKYEHIWEQFQLDYAAWVQCVTAILPTVDLRSVPRYAINNEFTHGEPSLLDTVARAELIVVGNVIGFSPLGSGGTLTAVAIDQSLKAHQHRR